MLSGVLFGVFLVVLNHGSGFSGNFGFWVDLVFAGLGFAGFGGCCFLCDFVIWI